LRDPVSRPYTGRKFDTRFSISGPKDILVRRAHRARLTGGPTPAEAPLSMLQPRHPLQTDGQWNLASEGDGGESDLATAFCQDWPSAGDEPDGQPDRRGPAVRWTLTRWRTMRGSRSPTSAGQNPILWWGVFGQEFWPSPRLMPPPPIGGMVPRRSPAVLSASKK